MQLENLKLTVILVKLNAQWNEHMCLVQTAALQIHSLTSSSLLSYFFKKLKTFSKPSISLHVLDYKVSHISSLICITICLIIAKEIE